VSGNCFDDWGRNYLFESEEKVLETWPGRCKSNTEETVGGVDSDLFGSEKDKKV